MMQLNDESYLFTTRALFAAGFITSHKINEKYIFNSSASIN